MTIQPGVIIKFNYNQNLIVNGTVNGMGTAGNPIVFTSYLDDSAAGIPTRMAPARLQRGTGMISRSPRGAL